MNLLKTQAIEYALKGNWQKAAQINQEILAEDSTDIETMNRLGYALIVLGKLKEAKSLYKKVLDLDSKNPIALKNIKRLGELTQSNTTLFRENEPPVSLQHLKDLFLEENGKTKIIELVNVAEMKVTAQLRTGETLNLSIKRSKIFVLDNRKQYVGMLPDDIARRLIKFMEGGNTYEAYVKAVDEHQITIFVREHKRATRFKNQSSFAQINPKQKSFSKSRTYEGTDDDPDLEEE